MNSAPRPLAIVHRTPGLLPIEALTVLGLSAKPKAGGHPIGQFGTGLKYGVATILRLGGRVRLFIGTQEYLFEPVKKKFRDAEYTGLRMRKKGPSGRFHSVQLPFTTEYGKYWKPWMAFREFHSNTLDEQGFTAPMYPRDAPGPFMRGGEDYEGFFREGDEVILEYEGHTTFVVELPEYVDAWLGRDSIFLPNAARGQGVVEDGVQVLAGESDALYYRGLKVLELPKKSVFTYNILSPQALTEDRTLAGDWMARWALMRHLATRAPEDVVEPVLTADESYWEHGLELPPDQHVSPAFLEVTRRNAGKVHHTVYAGYTRVTRAVERPLTYWERCKRPWSVERAGDDEHASLVDANGKVVAAPPPGMSVRDWGSIADGLARLANRHADADEAELAASLDKVPLPTAKPVVTSGGIALPDDDEFPF